MSVLRIKVPALIKEDKWTVGNGGLVEPCDNCLIHVSPFDT